MKKETKIAISNAIEAVGTPIVRALGLPCYDPATDMVRPDSPCGRVKANLHSGMDLTDAFYDGYFRKPQPKKKE